MSTLPNLTPQEAGRYNRHIILADIGLEGQKKLKAAKVLIIGAGGLGSPVALYLAAAGVGTIGIIDSDVVEDSNLQRQVLYGVSSLGKPKVMEAKRRIEDLNPYISITPYQENLTSKNALDIIKDYDIIIDGTDNFATRYLVNDACVFLNKPNCYGSIFKFDGQASVFHYQDGPCYRCLFPEPPPKDLVPSCAEGGVLGVLPALIGSIQATEAIKIITNKGTSLKGRLMTYNALEMKFSDIEIHKDEECCVCGSNPTITELIDYQAFCGVSQNENSQIPEITPVELHEKIQQNHEFTLLDVREGFELEISKIPGSIHIPLGEVAQRYTELDFSKDIIVYCKAGGRSLKACDLLQGNSLKVYNLKGGINAWAKEVDNELPTY